MSHATTAVLHEILQAEYNCELVGLVPTTLSGRAIADLHVPPEKMFHLRETYLSEDTEAEDFMMMYLEVLRICKQELERMDTMSDEFCASYLDALKPDRSGRGSASPFSPLKRKLDGDDPNESQSYSSHKTRRGNLPKASTNLLKKWLFDHLFHPYPTEEEKSSLSLQTGLSLNQISNWFINARRRTLQPMLESVRQTQGVEAQGGSLTPQTPKKSSSKKKNQAQQEEMHSE